MLYMTPEIRQWVQGSPLSSHCNSASPLAWLQGEGVCVPPPALLALRQLAFLALSATNRAARRENSHIKKATTFTEAEILPRPPKK